MNINLNMNHARIAVLIMLSAQMLLSSSVNLLYKGTGDVLIGYAKDQAIPYILETDDVDMSCMMSEAFTPFILSFSRVTTPPYQLAIMFNYLSGSCSEFKAKEEELRYLRALHAKNITEAQDARITQKRLLNKAARQQLNSYHSLELAFTENPGDDCPVFASENTEFYWLIGLVNGLQAVLNDLASGGMANVPLDIALKVNRGATCLDNNKWWGLPQAIQAAIWINFPGSKPLGIDPLVVLEQSTQTGLQQNIRISQVIAAQVHTGLGNTEQVKEIIRRHFKERTENPTLAAYRFIDEVATLHLKAMSDYLWTEATGKRTPIGSLGTFWDDPVATIDTIDFADLL